MTDSNPDSPAGEDRKSVARTSAAPVWIVTRRDGLIQVPGNELAARLANGARQATPRDLKVAGVTV